MAYVPTTFVDRSVEFPNRRKLTAVSGQADTFDVARAEGTVFATGTKPDAASLNAEFGKIKTETDSINTSLTDNGVSFNFGYDINGNYGYYKVGADTVTPFNSGTKIQSLTLIGSDGSGYAFPKNIVIFDTSLFSKLSIENIIFGGAMWGNSPGQKYFSIYGSTDDVTYASLYNHIFTSAETVSDILIDISSYNFIKLDFRIYTYTGLTSMELQNIIIGN